MKSIINPRVLRLASFIVFCLTLLSCSGNKEVSSVLLLDKEWMIQSSARAGMSGEELSGSLEVPDGWFPAEVPSTVFGSLVKNGVYGDVFFGKNMENVDPAEFQGPWWYRRSFRTGNNPASTHILEFDGVIYRANIWLNEVKIASADTLKGAFRQYKIKIRGIARGFLFG